MADKRKGFGNRKKMTIRIVVTVFLAGMLLALSACGKGQPAEQPEPPEGQLASEKTGARISVMLTDRVTVKVGEVEKTLQLYNRGVYECMFEDVAEKSEAVLLMVKNAAKKPLTRRETFMCGWQRERSMIPRMRSL